MAIDTTIKTSILVCVEEDVGELLSELINAIEKEKRINVTLLDLSLEMSKSFYKFAPPPRK